MVVGDYVLATKYSDGDPNDQWCVGFLSAIIPYASGDRYEVVDADGKPFRGNGFRRVKKISPERGKWLLERKQDIQNYTLSLWWWVRQGLEE